MSVVADGTTMESREQNQTQEQKQETKKPMSEVVELTPRTTQFLVAMIEVTADKRSSDAVVNDLVRKQITTNLKAVARLLLAGIGDKIVKLESLHVTPENIQSTIEVIKRKAQGMNALAAQLDAER